MPPSTVLTVNDLGKVFGPDEIFRHVSFQVADREHVALVGVNGAGKSTLLRIIAGIDLVLLRQEFHRVMDAFQLAARHRQIARRFRTARDHHGVEFFLQLIRRDGFLRRVADVRRQRTLMNLAREFERALQQSIRSVRGIMGQQRFNLGAHVGIGRREQCGALLRRQIGGAGEETILARVGEGIVSTIGSAESHKKVLENPDLISKTVLSKGLDAGTAFEILSIDIADVDVGDNIGAKLQTEQADADKRVAQAKAEVRRAAAVAVEQEMRARTQEMRAKVVEAEALVPQAMADAFRSGNLGIMDYVRMKNVQADTSMRESIAGGEKPRGEGM